MCEGGVEVNGRVDVDAEVSLAGFGGEDSAWARAYAMAAPGAVMVAPDSPDRQTYICVKFADQTVARLVERSDARDSAKREKGKQRSARVREAAEQVRAVGAYLCGELLCEVLEVWGDTVVLRGARDGDGEPAEYRVPVLVLVDADAALADHGMRAAPEHARRDLLARVRVGAVFNVPAEDVGLGWGDDPNFASARVVSVELAVNGHGVRPTRSTWERLALAGVPVASYDEARHTWDD
jgi:hypothetical protein